MPIAPAVPFAFLRLNSADFHLNIRNLIKVSKINPMYTLNDFPHTAKFVARRMARRKALLVVGRKMVGEIFIGRCSGA
jgi:hypothetical protein